MRTVRLALRGWSVGPVRICLGATRQHRSTALSDLAIQPTRSIPAKSVGRITTKPGVCRDCGTDLPVPRYSAKKRCDDCRLKKALTRTSEWKAAHPKPATKLLCRFQGGVGRPEKYHPTEPCLGEFERTAPNQKYCRVCAPFAKKALMVENCAAAYKAEPEKFARMARISSWKRKKAAGLPFRRLGHIYPCEYRDRDGNRGKGCKGIYTLTSSPRKFCENCSLLRKADRSRERYRNITKAALREIIKTSAS